MLDAALWGLRQECALSVPNARSQCRALDGSKRRGGSMCQDVEVTACSARLVFPFCFSQGSFPSLSDRRSESGAAGLAAIGRENGVQRCTV